MLSVLVAILSGVAFLSASLGLSSLLVLRA